MRPQLPIGQTTKFNIAQGLDVGTAKIIAVDIEGEGKDKQLYYKLEVIEGSQANMHRNEQGELWVNDFEVKAIK